MPKLYAISIITTILLTTTVPASDIIYISKSFYKNKALDKKSNKNFNLPKDIKNINKNLKQKSKKQNNKKYIYVKDIVA